MTNNYYLRAASLFLTFLTITLTVMTTSLAFATATLPPCFDGSVTLAPINDQVLAWKTSTPNQFRRRALVQGTIDQIFPDHAGHHHFEIKIGSKDTDILEVIYNEDFGPVPALKVGSTVEACGDYITSIAQSGPYPPSPSGGIIHWVHKSPNLATHPSGFLAIDGVVCGQDVGSAGPKLPHYSAQ